MSTLAYPALATPLRRPAGNPLAALVRLGTQLPPSGRTRRSSARAARLAEAKAPPRRELEPWQVAGMRTLYGQ